MACLKNEKAATVGRAVVKILSVAVVPDILQSDNGGEFLGQCISYIKKYFPTVYIVKGRARKPSTQGSVERGNNPFKIALENWMQENPNESWSRISAFVVNASINSRPSRAKSNRSPYEAYYGKVCKVSADDILDGQLLKESQTEYGLAAVHSVMETVAKRDPSRLIKVELLNDIIKQADQLFIYEDGLSSIEKEVYDADAKIKEITDKFVQQFFSTTATEECTTTPECTMTPEQNDGKKRKGEQSGGAEEFGKHETRTVRPKRNVSRSEDTPDHKQIRQKIKEAQIKQAEKVNIGRAKFSKDRKDPLEVGDICTVSTSYVKKAPIKYLPVMVTWISEKNKTIKYCVACQEGHLQGNYGRNELMHHRKYTNEILPIDPNTPNFKNNLTIQDACKSFFNVTSCNGKGDCSYMSQCSCKLAGVFCTLLCHKG